MILLAFLPLAFIPPRDVYALYVPALPWALWTASISVLLRAMLARCSARYAGWLRLATQGTLAGLVVFWLVPGHARMFSHLLPTIHSAQNVNRLYHDQIRTLLPALPRGASVLVLNDPYPDDVFDAVFLIRLTFGDPTITVHYARIARSHGLTLDPKDYDAALDFTDNQFVLRRGPLPRVQLQ
jgi:hypothetical protein